MFTSSLYRVKDVAKVLQISPALAYRIIKDGQLPAVRFGRTVRVKPEDLENFIQNNMTSSTVHICRNHNKKFMCEEGGK